jgi:hypothetical protein
MGWAFKPRWHWKSPLDNYSEHHQHPLQKGYSKIRLPNTATGGTSKTARHTFIRNSFSSTRFNFHANNQKKTMLSLSTSLVMALGARLLAQIFPRLPLNKKNVEQKPRSLCQFRSMIPTYSQHLTSNGGLPLLPPMAQRPSWALGAP